MTSFPDTQVQAWLDDVDTNAGATAHLRIYDGTPPADADAALAGNTLLAELAMSNPAFGAAAGGGPYTLTAAAITDDSSANASGTPTFARIYTAADPGGSVVLQCTAGVGSGELNLGAAITSGQPVEVTSLVVTLTMS